MRWLNMIFRELLGLFVDDGSFALAIIGWLALVWWVLPHLQVPEPWYAPILFGGLAVILVESVLRRARH